MSHERYERADESKIKKNKREKIVLSTSPTTTSINVDGFSTRAVPNDDYENIKRIVFVMI